MQNGGPWVEPPDATVIMETGFAGRIVYPETGASDTTHEMDYYTDIPVYRPSRQHS